MERAVTHPSGAGRQMVMLTAALSLMACHTWREKPIDPLVAIRVFPTRIRVTLTNRDQVEFDSARIAHDSLQGHRHGRPRGADDATAGIALNEIVRIEERKYSEGRSVGLGVGAVMGAMLLVAASYFLALYSWSWDE
jgi:hypothetical protein